MDRTRTGLLLNQKVISISMPVSDENNNFFGFLIVDVGMNNILSFINDAIKSSAIYFAIYCEVHGQKETLLLPNYNNIIGYKYNEKNSLIQEVINYPFKILAVYDSYARENKMYTNFIKIFLSFVIVCFMVIGLFYIIHIRNIKPIIRLAKIADLISKGRYDIKIPMYRATEVRILAEQLSSINRHVNELERVKSELSRKKIEAEIANKAKSEFMARISHELKTPLNVVIAFSEIMKNQLMGSLNEKYIEYSNDIYESGQKLLFAIDDILHISTAEAGIMKNKREIVNVTEMIQKIINEFHSEIKKKSLNVSIAQDVKSTESYISPMLTERVVWHIISNSIKFSKQCGSIDITILAGISNEYLTIIIQDNGIGIADDKLNIAYSAFDQLDGGLKRRFEGMGIGLSLAKKIVNLQNGFLDIVSKPSEGVMVRIKIPVLLKEPTY